ncbi:MULTISPECIES: hypothetical protein [Variovorax]|uniref:hypothetical protein n=1 Tax=Variovorax TaxID=34072 RepID=UPI00285B5E3D|nr:hypothetical protein [Variovorax sp. 3319]MDR6889726.1 hypothetical protein [Variovorax sp. 3319]
MAIVSPSPPVACEPKVELAGPQLDGLAVQLGDALVHDEAVALPPEHSRRNGHAAAQQIGFEKPVGVFERSRRMLHGRKSIGMQNRYHAELALGHNENEGHLVPQEPTHFGDERLKHGRVSWAGDQQHAKARDLFAMLAQLVQAFKGNGHMAQPADGAPGKFSGSKGWI